MQTESYRSRSSTVELEELLEQEELVELEDLLELEEIVEHCHYWLIVTE